MQILETLRNIEFGADPYELAPTPAAVERAARVYLFARDAMKLAATWLVACPTSPDRSDAMTAARDSFIFAGGDLWNALRSGGHYHRLFAVDGHWIYLSDAQGPARPYILAVDSEGRRMCPACYGAGVYSGLFQGEDWRSCVCCNTLGFLTVTLPGCTRKELAAHVD